MSIGDLSKMVGGGFSRGSQAGDIVRATVSVPPPTEHDALVVTEDGYDVSWPTPIPANHWSPRGMALPQKGDKGLLVIDRQGDAWFVEWSRAWVDPTAIGAAGGDLNGTYPNPAVAKLGGVPIPSVITSAAALPAVPVDGQEVYYVADATNGSIWHLKYRAASSSARKWEFVGGTPLISRVETDETFAESASYVDPATAGPSVTLPFAGDYRVSFRADLYVASQTTSVTAGVSVGVNGAQPSGSPLPLVEMLLTAGFGGTAHVEYPTLARSANDVLKLMYNVPVAAGGTAHARWRALLVTPIRVG